ncbi:unnamed protein product [Mytilus edulis]|uniref:Uncharacterized protein n=1 Tax=Mytilus edulis TaxID=6550 RepID=A0A8S3T5F6_MYTED|nr:unnamed protein product [Mytilus edulis]
MTVVNQTKDKTKPFVADNVDRNIRTRDGNDTFHGNRLVVGITSGTMTTDAIHLILPCEGDISTSEACNSTILETIEKTVVTQLKTFTKAERTGNWNLHLEAISAMLPYLAASGYNLYTQSAYVCFRKMKQLLIDHPEIFAAFQKGHHVMRRSKSGRYLAGL